MNNINPRALLVLWALTMLMAGAIALGHWWVIGVGGVIIAYAVYALTPDRK